MPRDSRDRAHRRLTRAQIQEIRERAKAIKKSTRRKLRPKDYLQFSLVVLIIATIVLVALRLGSK